VNAGAEAAAVSAGPEVKGGSRESKPPRSRGAASVAAAAMGPPKAAARGSVRTADSGADREVDSPSAPVPNTGPSTGADTTADSADEPAREPACLPPLPESIS